MRRQRRRKSKRKRGRKRRSACVIDFGKEMGREYPCEQGLRRTRMKGQRRRRNGRRKSGWESRRKSMRKGRRKRRGKRRSECAFDLGEKMGREYPCEKCLRRTRMRRQRRR
jgi:hypothetical protein